MWSLSVGFENGWELLEGFHWLGQGAPPDRAGERPLPSTACLPRLLLQVNGVDLRSASHEEAITALRQTPPKVRLVVFRDETHYRDEENLEIFPIDLQKKVGRGLGLSIVGKR